MDVRDIVRKFLISRDFDGLSCEECGCGYYDLMPCDETCISNCHPAYRCVCTNCGEEFYSIDRHDNACNDCCDCCED